MSAFFGRVDRDLAASIAALGQTFQFQGIAATVQTIPCGITRPSDGNAPMEGGSWDEYSGMVVTRLASLSATGVPVEGQTITVDGESVFVGKVKSTSDNPVVTIMFSNHPLPQ